MASEAASVAMARVVARLDQIASAGAPLSEVQLARLKNLSKLESTLVSATNEGDDEAMVAASQRLLAWLDAPDAEVEQPRMPSGPEQDGGARPPSAESVGTRSRVATPDPALSEEAVEAVAFRRPTPPPPPRLPSRLTKPNRPVDARLLREDLQKRLRKNWSRIMDLFVKWDVNGDGHISESEFMRGLVAIGVPADKDSVSHLFADLEKNIEGQVSFTELNRAIRAQPLSEEEKRRRAGGPVTLAVPITRESYAAQQAERRQREAEGASAKTDVADVTEAGDGSSPNGRRASTTSHVLVAGKMKMWDNIVSKVVPGGHETAPKWQKDVVNRAKLKVEKRKLDERKALASAQMVAFWGTPKRAPEAPHRRDTSIAGLEKMRDMEPTLGDEAGEQLLRGFSVDLDDHMPPDTETTNDFKAWLKDHTEIHKAKRAEAQARLENYEHALSNLNMEKQRLEEALVQVQEKAQRTEPAAKYALGARVMETMRVKLEKKKRELQLMQKRANDMVLSTEKLVEIIDSLRNERSKYVVTLRTMGEKEQQLDADSATLLSAAHQALEEHERCKAKHSRLRYEAEATVKTQLRDGIALRETIAQLDKTNEELQARVDALDLEARQLELTRQRIGREAAESRGRRYGQLSRTRERWAREFGRVAEKTGIWIDGNNGDAVEQVIRFYTTQETTNSSLFRMVNTDLASQIDEVEKDLAALNKEEESLRLERAAQAARDASGCNPAARRTAAALKTMELTRLADDVKRALTDVMPVLDALSQLLGVELEGESRGQPCSMTNIDSYMTQIEAKLLALHAKAHHLTQKPIEAIEAAEADDARNELLTGWTAPVVVNRAPVLNGRTVKAKGVDEIEL